MSVAGGTAGGAPSRPPRISERVHQASRVDKSTPMPFEEILAGRPRLPNGLRTGVEPAIAVPAARALDAAHAEAVRRLAASPMDARRAKSLAWLLPLLERRAAGPLTVSPDRASPVAVSGGSVETPPGFDLTASAQRFRLRPRGPRWKITASRLRCIHSLLRARPFGMECRP